MDILNTLLEKCQARLTQERLTYIGSLKGLSVGMSPKNSKSKEPYRLWYSSGLTKLDFEKHPTDAWLLFNKITIDELFYGINRSQLTIVKDAEINLAINNFLNKLEVKLNPVLISSHSNNFDIFKLNDGNKINRRLDFGLLPSEVALLTPICYDFIKDILINEFEKANISSIDLQECIDKIIQLTAVIAVAITDNLINKVTELQNG